MGCGCKNNNANNANQAQVPVQQVGKTKQQQTEGIKQAIKKTVEKYYNVNKSSK
jgi:hypothetical protein